MGVIKEAVNPDRKRRKQVKPEREVCSGEKEVMRIVVMRGKKRIGHRRRQKQPLKGET